MITTEMLSAFSADMNQAMAAVYQKYGLTAGSPKFSFEDSTFKMIIVVGESNVIGSINPSLYKGMVRHCWKYNLSIDDLNKEFNLDNETYTLIGINQGGHHAVGQNTITGKLCKLNINNVANALGKKP